MSHARAVTRRIPPILRADACQHDVRLSGYPNRYTVMKSALEGQVRFRAMARTILDEVLGFRPDFIEHQLAHAVRDPNGRAYNRTAFLPERTIMMQAWADYLDRLKADENLTDSTVAS